MALGLRASLFVVFVFCAELSVQYVRAFSSKTGSEDEVVDRISGKDGGHEDLHLVI